MANRGRLEHLKRACFGKEQFYNLDLAEQARFTMKNKLYLESYHCENCKRYHIGHIKKESGNGNQESEKKSHEKN